MLKRLSREAPVGGQGGGNDQGPEMENNARMCEHRAGVEGERATHSDNEPGWGRERRCCQRINQDAFCKTSYPSSLPLRPFKADEGDD